MITAFSSIISALASHLRLAYRVLRRSDTIMDSCKIPASMQPALLPPPPSSSCSESSSLSCDSTSTSSLKTSDPNACLLLSLPPELIDGVMQHLSPCDLAAVSATCHALRNHALSDVIWQAHVQANVPGVPITSPAPCSSYRELYAAHDPVWFLPKYKIWFCDRDLMGKLIVVRYDPRRGCIEGYQLLASRNRASLQPWAGEDQVVVNDFDPQVSLHLDKPVLQFRIRQPGEDGGFSQRPGANRFSDEIPMDLEGLDSMFSNFLLSRPLEAETAEEQIEAGYPYGGVWPPPAVPSRHRIIGASDDLEELALDPNYHPQSRSQVSDQTFRVRQWMEMAGSPITPNFNFNFNFAPGEGFAPGGMHTDGYMGAGGVSGIRIGEEIISYSTVDPTLYTPTPLKPWRGLWVGDYSGHGCEFILIHQPDDEPATDAELGLHRYENETNEQWEKRRIQAHTYRGKLEAIKLTGDPNVPRGEHTFIVDDLGPDGYLGDAAEAPFTGVRMVKGRGHVAGTGFMGDKFIDTQLMLISHDRLAMHWVEYGHVSYFERVDIDKFLKP